jgi:adenylate kinase family enzyme
VPSAVKDAKAETFRLHTAPLCDALLDQGKLIVLNADASEEEVTEALLDVIATA